MRTVTGAGAGKALAVSRMCASRGETSRQVHAPSVLNFVADHVVLDPAEDALLLAAVDVHKLAHGALQALMEERGRLHGSVLYEGGKR